MNARTDTQQELRAILLRIKRRGEITRDIEATALAEAGLRVLEGGK